MVRSTRSLVPAGAPVVNPAAVVAPDSEETTWGLSADKAASRLVRFGRNELVVAPRISPLVLFARQFANLLVVILAVAALLALAVGDVKDAAVIAVVLLLNATLGFVQERRAEAGIDALRAMLAPRARVRRDGRVRDVDAAEVVPGDVLLIESGDRVAADGRLLRAAALAVDESALTGESVPADKTVQGPGGAAAAVMMNTVVTRGRGEVLVTATGMQTVTGQLAGLIQSAPQRATPLQRQLARLGRRLAAVAGVAVAAVFVLALVRGDDLTTAALDAIALAVAAIPEGLPAVVTVTLALGTARMAKRRAIVKRLSSVETLGSATVICTDKTGTLTRNEMTARRVWRGGAELDVTGEGYELAGSVVPRAGAPVDVRTAAELAVLCSDAEVHDGVLVGDPTEGALVVWAAKAGVDVAAVRAARPRIAELPFDSATKVMATVHDDADGRTLVVKGAPDVVLARCIDLAGSDGTEILDNRRRAEVGNVLTGMGREGLRVLAVASRTLPPTASTADVAALLDGLRLEVLVGIVDPPRAEAAAAIRTCAAAGIRVLMITGDHASTAGAIAAQLGLRGQVLAGADLDALDDATLRRRLDGVGVIARVSPAHKLRIIEALQGDGQVVAMTGDGVNDAPALKGADIGVAMGITGTDVAKDAADMVLADDDFATIVRAVEHGRAIYDNIVSFVRFQLATNIGAITAIFVARLIGLPAPFTALQILWVNLIVDGPPAMALGVDPARADTMQRPPRDPSRAILDPRRLVPLLVAGAVMAAGTLAAFVWGREAGGAEVATTMAFTTFVLFQLGNALNARVEHGTVLSRHTLRNAPLWAALGGVLVLQLAALHLGLGQRIFDTVPLSASQWATAAGIASTIVVVEELRKLAVRHLGSRR
jgi:P-type Ca2+ transporter type 2C